MTISCWFPCIKENNYGHLKFFILKILMFSVISYFCYCYQSPNWKNLIQTIVILEEHVSIIHFVSEEQGTFNCRKTQQSQKKISIWKIKSTLPGLQGRMWHVIMTCNFCFRAHSLWTACITWEKFHQNIVKLHHFKMIFRN